MMKFPIQPNSPEWHLAEIIANELLIEGLDSGIALPIAIKLMAIIDQSHDDPMIGIELIKKERINDDEWWIKYHPKTKRAKEAKKRLKNE